MKKLMLSSIILIIFICSIFSGCSTEIFDFDELMRPPKLSDEQNQIYTALTAVVGDNIKLRYPKSGNNRSAFILEDLDGDNQEESIVFYEYTNQNINYGNQNIPNSNVMINLLKKTNGVWTSICDVAGLSSDIEKVEFNVFKKGGPKYLIIGYDLFEGNKKNLAIYSLTSNKLLSQLPETYSYFDVVKVSNSDNSQLLILNTSEKGCSAKLYSDYNIYNEVPLNPLSKKYINVTTEERYGATYFYIDSTEGIGLSTEIIKYQDKKLTNITTPSRLDFKKFTYRPFNTFSMDIDKNGLIEIPITQVLPGHENYDINKKKYLTKWSIINGENNDLVLTETLYTVSNNNYYYIIPESWVGKISIKENAEDGIWRIVKYTGGDLTFDEQEIMSIATYQTSILSEQKMIDLAQQNYILASSDNINSYFIKLEKDVDQQFKITEKEAIANLKLIS